MPPQVVGTTMRTAERLGLTIPADTKWMGPPPPDKLKAKAGEALTDDSGKEVLPRCTVWVGNVPYEQCDTESLSGRSSPRDVIGRV